MRIYECADYRAMSRRAASLIAAQVVLKPEGVLGLATGSTPIGLYSQLVEWYKQGDLSFAGIRSVNLDEYLGLWPPPTSRATATSCSSNLFDHIDIKPENTHVLNGLAARSPRPSARPTTSSSGSLGGMWTCSCWAWATTATSPSTSRGDDFGLEHPRGGACPSAPSRPTPRFFEKRDEVPRQALSMGIKSIMRRPADPGGGQRGGEGGRGVQGRRGSGHPARCPPRCSSCTPT